MDKVIDCCQSTSLSLLERSFLPVFDKTVLALKLLCHFVYQHWLLSELFGISVSPMLYDFLMS